MGVLILYLMALLCVAFVEAQPITQDFTIRYSTSSNVQDTTTMFPGVLFYTTTTSVPRFKLMVNSTSISGLKNPISATATKSRPNAKKYTLFVVFSVLTINGFVSLRGSTQTQSVTLFLNNVRYMGNRDDTQQTVTGSIIGIGETNVPVPPCRAPPNAPLGLNTASTCGDLAVYCSVQDGRNLINSQLGGIQLAGAVSFALNAFLNAITSG